MAARYYIGRGGRRWQDRRNWTSRPGGFQGASAPTSADTIVLSAESPPREIDLFGCPASVELSGFRGVVHLPSGGTLDLRAAKRPWWRRLLRREPRPKVAPAVRATGWRPAVRLGLATLVVQAASLVVIPLVSGGVSTRYMVAAGNWNDTATWSSTSGGAPGASFPVAGDIVNIDSASPAGTLTVNVASAAASLTINKSGATVNCDAGTTFTGTVTLTAGTLNLDHANGPLSHVWGTMSGAGSGVRTLTPGAASISVSGTGASNWYFDSPNSNLTITANTATVTVSAANADMRFGGVNFQGLSLVVTGSGTPIFNGSGGTWRNITRTGTATKTDGLQFWSTGPTCTGTFTWGGNTTRGVNRLFVSSNTVGTQRTITAAAYVITGDVVFMDINLAYSGAASWTNAGNAYIGDALGNAGAVTTNATASATQTATGTASFTWSTHGWTSRVPLPQDDVVISNAFVAGRTITVDMPRLGRNIDLSGATGAPTFDWSTLNISSFGNLTMAANVITSGGSKFWTLGGRGAQTITSNGMTWGISGRLSVTAPGGSYTMQDALVMTANNAPSPVQVTAGTFNTGGFALTTGQVPISGGALTTVNFGTSAVTFNSTGAGGGLAVSNGTVNAASASFVFAAHTTSQTFNGNGAIYGSVTDNDAGTTAGTTFIGNNRFGTLTLGAATARTITIPANGTQTVTGTFTYTGSAGQLLSIVSSAPGTAATIDVSTATLTHSNTSLSSDVKLVFTLTPAGGLTLGGTTATTRSFDDSPAGGLVLGGSAATTRSFADSPSAGLTLGGTATSDKTYTDTPATGLVLGGSTTTSVLATSTPVGGLVLSGVATSARALNLVAIGGLTLSGSTVTTRTFDNLPSGGIVLGGIARLRINAITVGTRGRGGATAGTRARGNAAIGARA